MSKEDHQLKYMQAVNRQQWNKQPNAIALIEVLPDCYRYTRNDGRVLLVNIEHGKQCHPIALCGR